MITGTDGGRAEAQNGDRWVRMNGTRQAESKTGAMEGLRDVRHNERTTDP